MRNLTQRIFYFPLTRIILGGIVCFLVIFIFNSLLFRPVLDLFPLTEDAERMIRFTMIPVVLFGTYHILFKYYEKRSISELKWKNLPVEGLSGFALGIIAVSFIVLILAITGYYKVLSLSSNILILAYQICNVYLNKSLKGKRVIKL